MALKAETSIYALLEVHNKFNFFFDNHYLILL